MDGAVRMLSCQPLTITPRPLPSSTMNKFQAPLRFVPLSPANAANGALTGAGAGVGKVGSAPRAVGLKVPEEICDESGRELVAASEKVSIVFPPVNELAPPTWDISRMFVLP